jgi:predicted nuclease of predicted toxin-antitoxin system
LARFLIDANMPRRSAELLAALGHDAVDVRDLDIARPDEAVFEFAQRENRAVVTRDLGFGDRARASGKHSGVVLLRVLGLRSDAIVDCMRNGLSGVATGDHLLIDTILVIEPGRTRSRRE